MRAHVLLYGLLGGVLIVVLRLVEYQWLVRTHSAEIYGGLIAAIFAGVGIWLGRRLPRPVAEAVVREVRVPVEVLVPVEVPVEVRVPADTPFARDERQVDSLGLTRREIEILELIAEGLSNREIAERVHVSENTVKTHSSRVFDKLGARRRTQAVQLAKQQRIIP